MKAFTTARVIAYTVALFLAGGATGAMLATKLTRDRMYRAPNGAELAAKLRDKLESRLCLTAAQLKNVDPIITETAARLQDAHRDSLKRTGYIMKEFNARIATELTEEQRSKLDEMEKERQDFIRRKCRPRANHRDPSERAAETVPSPKKQLD